MKFQGRHLSRRYFVSTCLQSQVLLRRLAPALVQDLEKQPEETQRNMIGYVSYFRLEHLAYV